MQMRPTTNHHDIVVACFPAFAFSLFPQKARMRKWDMNKQAVSITCGFRKTERNNEEE
jgi:hypothetical protein